MSLPANKSKRLADKVSESTRKHWDEQVKELTSHDVPEKQARDIVTDGILDAASKWGGIATSYDAERLPTGVGGAHPPPTDDDPATLCRLRRRRLCVQ